MLPALHKHPWSAVFAAFVCLLLASSAHAATGPRMKAAYASDADRDGHVDAVSITWSKKARVAADRRAPFPFSVAGYTVTRVDRAAGRKQRIQVAERPECDTGGSVRLAYAGSRRIARHRLDMRRFDPPFPRITCAITLDADFSTFGLHCLP